MDTTGAKRNKAAERTKKGSVPSPEGENQVGDRMEQSTSCRTVPRCSVRSPKVTEREDAEGQSKKVMELTKGRIAEWIGDPDLLRRMVLRSIFLATINTFLNS
ncbi:hypothetical protein MTR67_017977 [Solanum verrucosum]|uniref:Uncharacterized protein n=1 Tax=Solanum verrucosum TaxID=315347 RepID=A0AAF0TL71_SOLVR|nr:hypothetical protein MTR67_017977 [Solanum verrucosum]